jgi:hypothetical protein
MLTSVIELTSVIAPVIVRWPERLLETEHRADMVRIRVEQGQILMQVAQRALLQSQECLDQRPTPCRSERRESRNAGADAASDE